MEKSFDRSLTDKIKATLHNHEEPYQIGAWENFIAKKKSRHKQIFLWIASGIAASVLLAFPLYFYRNGWQKVETKASMVQEKKLPGTPEQDRDNLAHREDIKDIPGQRDADPGWDTQVTLSQEELSEETPILSEKLFSRVEKRNPESLRPDEGIDTTLLSENKVEGDTLTQVFNDKNPVYERSAADKPGITLGVFLSPGFRVNGNDDQSINSSTYGGGISIEVPLSSRFSLSSGLTFNYLNIDREEILPAREGSNFISQVDHTRTDQLNLDVPLNIKYSIPTRKENLYVLAGVSSFYSLSQQSDITSAITREVDIVREGTHEVTTVMETIVDTRSFEGNANIFYPAAMINLAVGFTAYRSDHITYELQPFYQHPLRSLTNDDKKFPMGGITIRVMFTKSR